MAKKHKRNRRNEAAVSAVIDWLEGRLHGMADLLDEALNGGNQEQRVSAGFLLANDIADAAKAAARVLKGEASRFEWERYEQEAAPIDLVHLLQIPTLGDDGQRGDEARRILCEAAALLEAKITTAANMAGDVQWIARHSARQLTGRA